LNYAERAGLLNAGVRLDVQAAVKRRIRTYQGLYLVAVLLSNISTYVSIGCIVLLQLMSAIGPRITLLSRF
jgi:uncharacterized membrane protein YdcZ (DUF606 family)